LGGGKYNSKRKHRKVGGAFNKLGKAVGQKSFALRVKKKKRKKTPSAMVAIGGFHRRTLK